MKTFLNDPTCLACTIGIVLACWFLVKYVAASVVSQYRERQMHQKAQDEAKLNSMLATKYSCEMTADDMDYYTKSNWDKLPIR